MECNRYLSILSSAAAERLHTSPISHTDVINSTPRLPEENFFKVFIHFHVCVRIIDRFTCYSAMHAMRSAAYANGHRLRTV